MRRLVLAALMLPAVRAAGLVLAWENRSALGLGGDELVACSPDPDRVRLPKGNASPVGRWAPSTPFPAMRDELRATAVGEMIYVGLGLQPGGPFHLRSISELYAFDPERETFERVADLPSELHHPAMASDGRYVYLIGGWRDGVPSAEAWRYDTHYDRWQQLPSLRFPRAAAGAAVIGSRLYVAGGAAQRSDAYIPGIASLEIYDLES